MSSKTNIAQQSKYFSTLAMNWWDPQGPASMLHAINPLRIHYILQHTKHIIGKKIVDVGCGGGILTETLAQEGALVTGIDTDELLLKVARIHAQQQNLSIQYLQRTAVEFACSTAQYYDIVICMEVLEHLSDPMSTVQACCQLVRPGGQLFFSTINRTFKAWLLAIVAAEYIFGWLPRGMHDIKKFIRPSELCGWLDATAVRERHIIGLQYNPILRCFTFSEHININYLIAAQHTQ